jgi:uncharacterized lipoprotein YajG
MNKKLITLVFSLAAVLLVAGCVAFPPLISVEHKDSPAGNAEVVKRLDAIDHRLDQLEQKTPQK